MVFPNNTEGEKKGKQNVYAVLTYCFRAGGEYLVGKNIISLIIMVCVFWGWGSTAFSAVSGKGFSIVYSSDERGAVTPCG
ncbi:MAG: hypothetical protein KAI69_01360 [Deltaproteobacteria bacterium]|nr:hypothetical protein [Deltaproteobacteria bacterium]